MNSPILVWMLYLNREVTTEVSNTSKPSLSFPLRHKFSFFIPFPFPPFPRPELPS